MEHFKTLLVKVDDEKPSAKWSTFYQSEEDARRKAMQWIENESSRVAVVKHRNGAIVAVYTSK